MTMIKRDPRRRFTWLQRFKIWVRAGGKCEGCGVDLDDDWDAHHEEPHAIGGTTEIFNGRALCVACHKMEHRPMSMDSPNRKSAGGFFKDYSWQEDAVEKLMNNLQLFYSEKHGEFERAYVVEVSPSGGKTTFALKAARAMIQAGLIDKVFAFVPRETIKTGFRKDTEFVVMDITNRLDGNETIQIDDKVKSDYKSMLRNFHGAVINYASLSSFLGLFELYASRGVRMLFVFDEVHHASTGESEDDDSGNSWGEDVAKVRAFANVVICMTGTPMRTDGDRVTYLRYTTKDQIHPKTGQMGKVLFVEADYTFSYKMAIEAGVARKLIFRPQDPVVSFRYGKEGEMMTEYNGRLSGVPRNLIDRAKREIFSPKNRHVDDALRLAYEENERDRKRGDKDAAILVVVGPTDTRTGFNPLVHVAERVKALFGEEVVTVESEDPSARLKADNFREGSGRWVAAKDMINEGTSIPRIRTIPILRDIKSQVRFEQTVHRATRNRSDEFPQDAKVIFFHLQEMMMFAGTIEDEVRFAVQPEEWTVVCPSCKKVLEFRPRRGKPCVFCGWEPLPGPEKPRMEFEWLFSDVGTETVIQGGEDFSDVDPISRRVLDKLGNGVAYGGRHGLNEAFRVALNEDLVKHTDSKQEVTPWSKDEEIDKYWKAGLAFCDKTAGLLAKAQGSDYQEALGMVRAGCKRTAGMGRDKIEYVRRDYPDPLGTVKKFYGAAKDAFDRAKGRNGGAV